MIVLRWTLRWEILPCSRKGVNAVCRCQAHQRGQSVTYSLDPRRTHIGNQCRIRYRDGGQCQHDRRDHIMRPTSVRVQYRAFTTHWYQLVTHRGLLPLSRHQRTGLIPSSSCPKTQRNIYIYTHIYIYIYIVVQFSFVFWCGWSSSSSLSSLSLRLAKS